jgi:hypothetical protein
MIITPLSSAYLLFRTRAILFGDLAEFFSAFWRNYFRRFGGISFCVLAEFRSAFWRYFVRRFGEFLFGVLAWFRSAFWRKKRGTVLVPLFFASSVSIATGGPL